MKDFVRDNLWFFLCGLNCGLCLMKLDGQCPGCDETGIQRHERPSVPVRDLCEDLETVLQLTHYLCGRD